MTDREFLNLLDALIKLLIQYWFITLIIGVFFIIVDWKILEKAGERGWKQFIPVYSAYIEFKLYWDTSWFWLILFSPLIIAVSFGYARSNSLFLIIIIVLLLIDGLSGVIMQFKKAKAFGEGFFFGIGLCILNPLFRAILAFDDKCKYIYFD